MGSTLSSFGLNGGANSNQGASGAGFNATGANLLQPATTAQATDLYNQSQQGLAQQQAFLQALQAQNGIGNQSSVYNQLQGVANGTGPNPAQAMLAQATGANVANQAALMAGQRGSGANTGLIARQVAQQGGSAQQQAAGQGATMQANQSLNALGQLGGIAGQQVAQQGQAVGNLNQFTQGEQSNILNSIAQQNNANVGMQSNLNNTNAGIAQGVMKGNQGLVSGLMNSAGGAATAMMASGGEVRKMYDSGGQVDANGPQSSFGRAMKGVMAPPLVNPAGQFGGGQSQDPNFSAGAQAGAGMGKTLMSGAKAIGKSMSSSDQPDLNADSGEDNFGASDLSPNGSNGEYTASKGGKVPALVSPGEVYLPPKKAKEVAKSPAKNPLKEGQKIPGQAKVSGDSLKNDTVKRTLDAGGIVIPRSIVNAKDAPSKAAAFVRAHLAKNGLK